MTEKIWNSFLPVNKPLIVTDGIFARLCYYNDEKELVNDRGFVLDRDYRPTHWMLLPDPPNSK